jgi:hypothetical protein
MAMTKHVLAPALAALSLCACVTLTPLRQDLGEVDVKADPPLLNTQLVTSYGFRVEAGRIFLTRPGGGGLFDFSIEEGCLRGLGASGKLREFCKRPNLPDDPPGTARFRSSTSPTTFTAQTAADGRSIQVEAALNKGTFVLGEGPAADELRRHPEFLGLAFIYGLLPACNGTAEESTRDFKWVVSQVPAKVDGRVEVAAAAEPVAAPAR